MVKIPERRMLYPYTYTAKLVQFPYKFHFQNSWWARYYCYAFVLGLPVFYKISKLANSPENVRRYEEDKRKEAEEHGH